MREERRADISQSRRKIHQKEQNAKPEASAHNMVRVIFYSESAARTSTETEPTLTHPFFILGVASSLLMLSGGHFFVGPLSQDQKQNVLGRAIQFFLGASSPK